MDRPMTDTGAMTVLLTIQKELQGLLDRSKGVLAHSHPSSRDLEEAVLHLAEIRKLISDLALMPDTIGGAAMRSSLNELREQYLDLEGAVKELRNDRTRRS